MKKEIQLFEKEAYIAPDIEVVKIEMEHNLFAGSGDGELNDMNDDYWH